MATQNETDAEIEESQAQAETVAEDGQNNGACLSLMVVFSVLGVSAIIAKTNRQ